MQSHSEVAKQIRLTVLDMIFRAQVSHIGSNFSGVDILTVIYSKADFRKDELIVSKGWVAASVYALGVKYGILPKEAIDTFCDGKSPYVGLVEPLGVFGAKISGGSMGLGLPGAVGLALAKKLKNEDGKVYVLMSDGELQCGTTWESMLIAEQHNLDNLITIVDRNGFQAMGRTDDILRVPDLGALHIDGHNYQEIEDALNKNYELIFANTVKGKGVSFMENNNLWHYAQIKEDDYKKAMAELHAKD